MTAHSHNFVESRTPVPAVRAEIAAFAATLDPRDEMFWPAHAAADGCLDSLAELNALLDASDCFTFVDRVPVGMTGAAL